MASIFSLKCSNNILKQVGIYVLKTRIEFMHKSIFLPYCSNHILRTSNYVLGDNT